MLRQITVDSPLCVAELFTRRWKASHFPLRAESARRTARVPGRQLRATVPPTDATPREAAAFWNNVALVRESDYHPPRRKSRDHSSPSCVSLSLRAPSRHPCVLDLFSSSSSSSRGLLRGTSRAPYERPDRLVSFPAFTWRWCNETYITYLRAPSWKPVFKFAGDSTDVHR